MKKKNLTKEERDQEIREEIRRLSDEAGQTRPLELGLFDDATEDGDFNISLLADTQDPDLSHRLFYTIRALLIEHLPKGPENKKLRDFIYNEKNDFLNRGQLKDSSGIRGSDGRMTYTSSHLGIALNTVIEWAKTGGNPWDIYEAFEKLNIEHGYKSDYQSKTDKDSTPAQ